MNQAGSRPDAMVYATPDISMSARKGDEGSADEIDR